VAELRHVIDQLADRLDQVAVDQPQAQQTDQRPDTSITMIPSNTVRRALALSCFDWSTPAGATR
jgi:hypothetical protein